MVRYHIKKWSGVSNSWSGTRIHWSGAKISVFRMTEVGRYIEFRAPTISRSDTKTTRQSDSRTTLSDKKSDKSIVLVSPNVNWEFLFISISRICKDTQTVTTQFRSRNVIQLTSYNLSLFHSRYAVTVSEVAISKQRQNSHIFYIMLEYSKEVGRVHK